MAEKWFIIFQRREAQEKSVICHLNIIWQFARIGNNVTDGSSILNTCSSLGCLQSRDTNLHPMKIRIAKMISPIIECYVPK